MSRAIRRHLPPRQQELMEIVLAYVKDYGSIPTHRYLSTALRMKHGGGIHDLLRGLERRGITFRRPDVRAVPTENQHPTRRINIRPALSHAHLIVPQGSHDGTKLVIREQ